MVLELPVKERLYVILELPRARAACMTEGGTERVSVTKLLLFDIVAVRGVETVPITVDPTLNVPCVELRVTFPPVDAKA